MPQKGVTVYDPEEDTARIRHCPNEPSIWWTRSDNAIKESVAFREGSSFHARSQTLQPLDMVLMNIGNGGKLFKEVDKKRDEEGARKRVQADRGRGHGPRQGHPGLAPYCTLLQGNINQPTSEIRYNLLRIAKNKTQEFIEAFDSPQVTTRYHPAGWGLTDHQHENDGVYRFDSNSLIVSVPVGQDPTDVMVRFCLTEKERQYSETSRNGSIVLTD